MKAFQLPLIVGLVLVAVLAFGLAGPKAEASKGRATCAAGESLVVSPNPLRASAAGYVYYTVTQDAKCCESPIWHTKLQITKNSGVPAYHDSGYTQGHMKTKTIPKADMSVGDVFKIYGYWKCTTYCMASGGRSTTVIVVR